MVNEFNETFKLTIEVSDEGRAANVTEGEISMTVVLIKDDDGKNNLIQLSIEYICIAISAEVDVLLHMNCLTLYFFCVW